MKDLGKCSVYCENELRSPELIFKNYNKRYISSNIRPAYYFMVFNYNQNVTSKYKNSQEISEQKNVFYLK